MSPVDERWYAALMEPERLRWGARASDDTRAPNLRGYAKNRVAALSRPYHAKLDRCATKGVTVRCQCPGKRDVRWFTCRQHLACERCSRERARKSFGRTRRALEARFAEEAAKGRRYLVLLTLTARHTGDLAADRAALRDGWRGLYKAMHRRGWGKFPYVGVWETTPGTVADGHVHAHVVAVWPYRPWEEVHEMWTAACPSSSHIGIEAGTRRQRGDKAVLYTPKTAAHYVSKYVSKGVQAGDFSPALAAEVVASSYGQKLLFSSVRFFLPFVPCCPSCKTAMVRDTVSLHRAHESRFAIHSSGVPPSAWGVDWHHPGFQLTAW